MLRRESPDLLKEAQLAQRDEIQRYKLLLSRYQGELENVNERMHALVERAVVPLSCSPTLCRLFGSEDARGLQHALRGYSLLKVSLVPQS
jgi:hypothetical protein